jgi:hypothetical protein
MFPVAISKQGLGKLCKTRAQVSKGFCEMNTVKKVLRKYLHQFLNEKRNISIFNGRLPKIALKWMPKQKRARGRPKKNWMESIRKAMNEKKPK